MTELNDLLVALARPVRHEANNLLAALSGTAELMRRAQGSSERDIIRAERLTDASARLQALLHAYLALGAPPSDGTSAAAVFDNMRPLVRLTLGQVRLTEMTAAPPIPPLAASPGALQAAILHLAQEAATMAPPDGTARLTLEAAPGGALLSATFEPAAEAPPPVFLPAAQA